MEKYLKIIFGIFLGVLLVFQIFQIFEINSLKNKISGNTVSNGELDTRGWTQNEIMNYEMHGTIPSRVQTKSNPSSSGMVGGC